VTQDAHTLEDELSYHKGDSDTDKDETQKDNTQWTDNIHSQYSIPVYNRFTGDPSGIRQNEAPTINKDSTLLSIFMLFSIEIIQLLVEKTNRYHEQYLDTLDKGQLPLSHVTIQEMYSFLAIRLQMGHDEKETMKAYWSTAEQLSVPFYGKTKQDILLYTKISVLQ
jgi:hypothetical protein